MLIGQGRKYLPDFILSLLRFFKGHENPEVYYSWVETFKQAREINDFGEEWIKVISVGISEYVEEKGEFGLKLWLKLNESQWISKETKIVKKPTAKPE